MIVYRSVPMGRTVLRRRESPPIHDCSGDTMHVKELGHLVLYVRDLERSRRFYKDVLGWHEVAGETPLRMPAAGFTSGRTHHELMLIEVGPSATPIPEGRRVGLYHFGLKIGET